jgi:hypothetical protein
MLSNIYTNGGNKHICENVEYSRKEKSAMKQST